LVCADDNHCLFEGFCNNNADCGSGEHCEFLPDNGRICLDLRTECAQGGAGGDCAGNPCIAGFCGLYSNANCVDGAMAQYRGMCADD
jgi:hypothetical protein